MEELKRIVEALLFASPDPLSISRIKSIVPGLENQHIIEAIDDLKKDYDQDSRSFQIVEIGGGFQLTSKPEYALWVGKLFESRAKQRLSKAALETLAVVAYKQPVLRSAIESVRGVNVDSVLRTLMERDLVRIVGRGEGPGRPLLFGTTRDFLLRFGLSRLSDLPKMEEVEQLVGDGRDRGDSDPDADVGEMEGERGQVLSDEDEASVGLSDDAGDEVGDQPCGDTEAPIEPDEYARQSETE